MAYSRKGFTLIELIVVVMIVAILAAVAMPTMTGNINRAKKTEGMAALGTIRTALRIYGMENPGLNNPPINDFSTTGHVLSPYISPSDLNGRYYNAANYSVSGGPNYIIKAANSTLGDINMDSSGNWNGY